jgi:chromosome segregation ATPase
MAEGNETPGGEPPRRTEGDLLAERRARRASETGDDALTRRAEAAEATVQTLETHVATLQQRLLEAEEQRRGITERAAGEQAAVLEREAELRRAKQREYAEQQLRVEAEDRLIGSERESRAQIDGLKRRHSASEQEIRELAERLESMQRQLAEAEQAAAAERTALRRAERELQARLTELECRALEIHRGLTAERAARERSEALLENMRRGHARVEAIVAEVRAVVGRLAGAFASAGPDAPATRSAAPVREGLAWRAQPGIEGRAPDAPTARSTEVGEALAAAVERLRARADDQLDDPPQPGAQGPGTRRAPSVQATAPSGSPAGAKVALPVAPKMAPAPAVRPASHKHSLSLIKRWRIRRKQRRSR